MTYHRTALLPNSCGPMADGPFRNPKDRSCPHLKYWTHRNIQKLTQMHILNISQLMKIVVARSYQFENTRAKQLGPLHTLLPRAVNEFIKQKLHFVPFIEDFHVHLTINKHRFQKQLQAIHGTLRFHWSKIILIRQFQSQSILIIIGLE